MPARSRRPVHTGGPVTSGPITAARRHPSRGRARRWWPLAAFVGLLGAGCGPGDVVKEVRIPVRQQATTIQRCREYLEGYARGEPVGSEVIGFQQLIEEATREDAAVGELLGRGLREIEASLKRPQEVAVKAKAILESLPPPTPAPAAPAD
jgi:hypothetical protein